MEQGVTFIAPETCWIGPDVHIGADSVVYPGCVLEGDVRLGRHCAIGPQTLMSGTVTTGDFCTVLQSRVHDTQMGSHVWVGPYAHLKEAVVLGDHIKIGNFVELKEASVGDHSFVSHLAYVGNASLGSHVNYGAGAITANYNHLTGVKAHTSVGDHVSIGANAVLVAPLEVADHAAVAAGSVITYNVAPYHLAVARTRQTNIKDWVKKQLAKLLPASMIQKTTSAALPPSLSVSSTSQLND
jgi:bifunctional UDP-N-acetylglucosamine pyrophosphorylase / glucosamine-1-phosphate N-acetyltransferase